MESKIIESFEPIVNGRFFDFIEQFFAHFFQIS